MNRTAQAPLGGEPTTAAAASANAAANAPRLRQWASQDLFGEHTEVQIHHRGQCYRLRKTVSGKLILTK